MAALCRATRYCTTSGGHLHSPGRTPSADMLAMGANFGAVPCNKPLPPRHAQGCCHCWRHMRMLCMTPTPLMHLLCGQELSGGGEHRLRRPHTAGGAVSVLCRAGCLDIGARCPCCSSCHLRHWCDADYTTATSDGRHAATSRLN